MSKGSDVESKATDNLKDDQEVAPKTAKSDVAKTAGSTKVKSSIDKKGVLRVFMYCLWVVGVFYGVQIILSLVIFLLPEYSLQPLISVELESFLMTSLIFGSTLAVLILAPVKILKTPLKGRMLSTLGLKQKLPRWRDIGLAIAAYVSCFAAAIGLTIAVQILMPSLDMSQAQSLPFDSSGFYPGYSLVWIYLTLGVAAPIGEELIFRGYLFGKVRKYLPASLTIVITAVVFSLLHVVGFDETGGFMAQWNVVIALFPLAIGLGLLREYTGSVWASVILHAIQNTVSFVLLFIVLPTQGIF